MKCLSRSLAVYALIATTACRDTIRDDSVASITVIPAAVSIEPSDTAALIAIAMGPAGDVLPSARIRWESSDTSVVRVSDAGVLRSIHDGTASVTASAGRRSASTLVSSQYPTLTGPREYAHRAFASLFPENTLVAVNGAFERGADGVEVDVQLTADHLPVIMHDATVDRTTNGSGRVDALTFAQVRLLNACAKRPGPWGPCQIPTPAEVLSAAHGRGMVILDLKGDWPATELGALLASVESAGLRDSVMMTSFSIDLLELVRRLDPRVVVGYLQPDFGDPTRLLRIGNAVSLVDEGALLRRAPAVKGYNAQLQAHGSLIGVFTLTSGSNVSTLRTLGVKWYISDVPLDKPALAPRAR